MSTRHSRRMPPPRRPRWHVPALTRSRSVRFIAIRELQPPVTAAAEYPVPLECKDDAAAPPSRPKVLRHRQHKGLVVLVASLLLSLPVILVACLRVRVATKPFADTREPQPPPPSPPLSPLSPPLPLPPPSPSFLVYSEPIDLRYGQAYMTPWRGYNTASLPNDVLARYSDGTRNMAIIGYKFDVVRRHEDGTETSVPIYELYVHHAYFFIGEPPETGTPARSLATKIVGADLRGTRHMLDAPFRHVVLRPRGWATLLHLINTRQPGVRYVGNVSRLSQCPCSPQRRINALTGVIDDRTVEQGGAPFVPCSAALLAEANPSCSLATYVGGALCCQHGMYVIDTQRDCAPPLASGAGAGSVACAELPVERFYFKVRVFYEDASVRTRPVFDLVVLGPSGAHKEYDVPQCARGTPSERCVHVAVNVVALGLNDFEDHGPHARQWDERRDARGVTLRIAYASPHQHTGVIWTELQDAMTNRTICRATREDSSLQYGTGMQAGNERGYLVGARSCTWGNADAPRVPLGRLMRTITKYDASTYLMGVMSIWVLYGDAVDE